MLCLPSDGLLPEEDLRGRGGGGGYACVGAFEATWQLCCVDEIAGALYIVHAVVIN